MWHNLPAKDYPNTEEYLAGIEVVRESFYTLIPKFINQPKTLLVLAPPYLATNQTAYKKEGYFGIIPFLKLMGLIRPPFVFFSSKQSDFIPYIDFLIEEKGGNWESFKGYEKISIETSQNYQTHYVDNMIYKF